MRTPLLLSLLCTPTFCAAALPVAFTQQPTINDMALGQSRSLHYTIVNQLTTHTVPIKSIKIINQGDKQADGAFQVKTTCQQTLAPGKTCSIDVKLNALKAGPVKRSLSIDYNGRAPLTSGLAFKTTLADYTVLVYIIGSNLESSYNSATTNIKQMEMIGSSSKLNIILETGGAKKIGWETVQRKIVYPQSVEFITDLGKPNMGAVSTMQDFIKWGVTQYPAKHYMFVFWDHGGGPNGGFGDNENHASLKALTSAVQQATIETNTHFELLGFDACLMATAEVAAALYPYTNYFIASEDLEPGDGWQYNTYLDYIVKHPQTNGLDLGKVIVDGYTEQNKGKSTTLSVVDSSKVPALIDALSSFASAAQSYVTGVDSWKNFAIRRLTAPDYSTSVWDKKSVDVVDLVSFAAETKNLPGLNATSLALENAVHEAVSYFKNSPNRNASSWGLTAYFPSIMAEYDKNYPANAVNFSQSYLDFVSNYYTIYFNNQDLLATNFTSINSNLTGYVGTISGGADVLYAGAGKTNCVNSNPCITTIQEQVSKTNNMISYDNQLHGSQWPLLNGMPVLLIPDDDKTFLVPVQYVNGTPGYLSILKTGNTYTVTGFQDYVGGPNTAQGKLTPIYPNDKFNPRVYEVIGSGWDLTRDTNKELKPPFVFTFGSLPSDLNEFRFLAEDLTGALINSTSISYPPG